MKICRIIVVAGLLCVTGQPPASATVTETSGSAHVFLRRFLVSGRDFYYPPVAAAHKEGGTTGCLMHLAPSGEVSSLRLVKSSGHVILDNHVMVVLRSFRFKAGTSGPLQWWITFRPEQDKISVILVGHGVEF